MGWVMMMMMMMVMMVMAVEAVAEPGRVRYLDFR
jgi:hypothetical protein